MGSPRVQKNQRAEGWLRVAEGSLFTPIFLMIGKIIPEVVKVGFFPAAGFFSLVGAFLVTREAKLQKWKDKGANFRAFLEWLTTAAIITGIVFSFAAATLAAPIIFTAALGVKALYNLGASIYYAVKACTSLNPATRSKNFKLAGQNFVGFLVNSAITVSVGFALIAAQPLWWLLGFGGAVAGAAFTAGTLLSSGNSQAKRGNDNDSDKGSKSESAYTIVHEGSPNLHSVDYGDAGPGTGPSSPTSTMAVVGALRYAHDAGAGSGSDNDEADDADERQLLRHRAHRDVPKRSIKGAKQISANAATAGLTRSVSVRPGDLAAVAASASVAIPTASPSATAANTPVTGTGVGLYSPQNNPWAVVSDADKGKERRAKFSPRGQEDLYD